MVRPSWIRASMLPASRDPVSSQGSEHGPLILTEHVASVAAGLASPLLLLMTLIPWQRPHRMSETNLPGPSQRSSRLSQ